MGPFNRGEVEYIKAISGGHSHHTYCVQASDWACTVANSGNSYNGSEQLPNDTNGRIQVWTLLDPKVFDPTNHPNDATNTAPIAYSSQWTNAHSNVPVYTVNKAADDTDPAINERRGEQFFLDKVTGRFRIVQQLESADASNEHMEYRLLVFRHKERQHFDQERALNFCNPDYDLFLSGDNYKVGVRGYRNIDIHTGNEEYGAFGGYYTKAQYLMTAIVNKEDYVVMKDTRFYLGKEYGGKHIYETTLSWDHRDQLESQENIIIDSETATKNYCWYIMLIGTANTGSALNIWPKVNYTFTTTGTS